MSIQALGTIASGAVAGAVSYVGCLGKSAQNFLLQAAPYFSTQDVKPSCSNFTATQLLTGALAGATVATVAVAIATFLGKRSQVRLNLQPSNNMANLVRGGLAVAAIAMFAATKFGNQ